MTTTKPDIESRLADLEPRILKLETDYKRDISAILEILRKLEGRMTGEIGANEVGLISEVRDLKREMSDNKSQLDYIQQHISEIKVNIGNTTELQRDVAILKEKVDKHEKYKWLVWGGLVTAGYLISNYKALVEFLK